MYVTLWSAHLHGLESRLVNVEVDFANGLPGFDLVGSLSTETKEARERVRVGLKNAGYRIPASRITINISPADLKKEGSHYDLAIAIGILAGMGNLKEDQLKGIVFLGEIGLSGDVRRIRGVLPILLGTGKEKNLIFVLPKDNYQEAMLKEDAYVYPVSSLSETISFLQFSKEEKIKMIEECKIFTQEKMNQKKSNFVQKKAMESGEMDFGLVKGQEIVKRAAMIAAAGRHHLLISGPPGAGKTMISRRIPFLLPPLEQDLYFDIVSLHSIAGSLGENFLSKRQRPFIMPHHTVTETAFAGGGRTPGPGLISLAHGGVLFLDEIPEFPTPILNLLRQPLEDKSIQINRIRGNYNFPADFLLIAAMNPCPCGKFPSEECTCSYKEIKNYLNRIPGPVLDRFDMTVIAKKPEYEDLSGKKGLNTLEMRTLVGEAIQCQKKRFLNEPYCYNSQISVKDLERFCQLNQREEKLIRNYFSNRDFSARAYHKILRISRTIADLEKQDEIKEIHLIEAIHYRTNFDEYRGKRSDNPLI